MSSDWQLRGYFFHGEMFEKMSRGIVRGGCPCPHAESLRVAVTIWATLVNTQTHTHREIERER